MEEFSLNLPEIVNCYLEHNGLSVSFMARKINIHFSSLFNFVCKNQKLSEGDIKKIWGFLNGGWLIPVDMIEAHDEDANLQELLKKYLELNNLSISYAARIVRVSVTSLARWLNDERDLSSKYIYRINEFLKGDFLIDINSIINHLIAQKELNK